MKEFILTNMEFIIGLVTAIVTYILGKLAKKSKKIKTNSIPIQNILIAIISSLIYYAVTNDFSMVVASGSPVATLLYDLMHSIKKEEGVQ